MPYTFAELEQIATYAESSGCFAGAGAKLSKAQAMMRLLKGQELGLPPIVSLGGLYFLAGRLNCDAGITATLLYQNGYAVVAEQVTNERCAMSLHAQGKVCGQAEFTLEDAKRAGLVRGGSNWEKYPQDMLWARCLTRLARRYAAHVFGGSVYSLGEIPEGDDETPGPLPVRAIPYREEIAQSQRDDDKDALLFSLEALKDVATDHLGMPRAVVKADLLAWAKVERIDQLTAAQVEQFRIERYDGVWELVQLLQVQAPEALDALQAHYHAYGAIPWDELLMLLPDGTAPRQDGDAAANELYGHEDGLVHASGEIPF